MTAPTEGTSRPVTLGRVGAAAWNLVGIALAVAVLAYVLGRVRVLVIAFCAATALATVLGPAVHALERRHVPRLLGTALAFVTLLGSLGLAIFAVAPVVEQQFADLGPVLSEGISDVEDWLVKGPLSLEREDVESARTRLASSFSDLAVGAGIGPRARAVAEVITGVVLALALTFFLVKDGPELQRSVLNLIPHRHRDTAASSGRAAWAALVGYVRGIAIIGVVEGVVITVTLAIVGADLAVPIGLLTVLLAFVPFLGAVLAGVLAVLSALVSGGLGDAAIVAIVALLLQQFDNEFLAPLVYGRMTRLHPIVVLAAVAGGAGMAGLAGAVLAVPVAATASAVVAEIRSRGDQPLGTEPAPP